MDETNIKNKAFSSVLWKFFERFFAQLVSFVISIVLARLLEPSAYSSVSVVLVFFAFANVLISGGLNTALIQKKDVDEEDYSTILYTSVLLAIIIYVLLFFAAPIIAGFYKHTELTLMIRVMGVILPINAIKSVWCAYVSSNLLFKRFFFSTMGGITFSGGIGLALALQGAGAWALIVQQMANTLIDTVILIFSTRMKVVPIMSLTKLKRLWSYGWKVFVSTILGTIYTQITPMVIGIKFSTENLSFYTRGRSFPELISSTTTNTLSAVLFPVLSKYQDRKERMLQYTRLYIRLASYITFPLMLGLFAVADNFVLVLLTEKWIQIVPFIRIFCVSHMFDMIASGNCESIKAMGRSDVFLVMEIIKKSSYFIIIALFLVLGDTATVLGTAYIVCAGVALIVNSVPNRKMMGYSYLMQFTDLAPNLIISVAMAVAVGVLGFVQMNPLLCVALQVILGMLIYLLLSIMFRISAFEYLKNYLKEFLVNRRKT